MQKKEPYTNKQHLSNILDRFKDRFKPPQASVEKVFIEVVDEVVGFRLKPENVDYSVVNKTIHLKVSSLLKTECKAKQSEIQTVLLQRLPKQDVPTVFL